MLARIRHRGPDDSGIYTTGQESTGVQISIGNNRLSILDLSSAGHQPMANEDQTIWVAYNGEIYNFPELRQELLADGHQMRSHSDTEVLPHLYEKYGENMVTRLNGIFAFAIWDATKEQLWLFRDRMGVKPLYYIQVGTRLYFASEIKALLACPEVKAVLDASTIPEYLSLLYVANPRTMFRNIVKLEPGCRLLWEKGDVSITSYWSMKFAERPASSEQEMISRLQGLVSSATERQLISDVPVGFLLSGGLDSSALLACAAASGASLRSYSISFRKEHGSLEQSDDDPRFARIVAQHFGSQHHEILVEPDVVKILPKIVWHLDEPIADHAAIATYLIAQMASSEATVLLSGQGADEVFGGYRVHRAHRLMRYVSAIPFRVRERLVRSVLPFLEKQAASLPAVHPGLLLAFCRYARKLHSASTMDFREQYCFFRSYLPSTDVPELLSPALMAQNRDIESPLLQRFSECSDQDLLNQLLYVDAKTFLPDLNLAYTDKLTMACSIEARVPFLDNEVVDFALQLPPSLKIKGLTQKYLLRKAFQNVLPNQVIERRKAGFGLPVRSWLRGELREMVRDLLSEDRVRARGLFQPAAVTRLIEENESGRHDNPLLVWALLSLELWQQAFLDVSQPAIDPSLLQVAPA
jgi:asparagine synthase (glutamine-hydrolysing)